MRGYLEEMFPLSGHLSVALLAALGIAGFTSTIQGARAALAPSSVISAAWNIFAIHLTLRLMDELKDLDIDRRLFPERPLPSGRVLESDVSFSLVAVILLYFISNLHSPFAALSAPFVIVYAFLMYKRFFAPELLKNSLLITLLTHTPIVPLIWLQAFITVAQLSRIPLSSMEWRPIARFVAMLWLATIAWELSRKIRCAEEENEYVTYSQIFGRAGAVAAAWAAQTLSLGICLCLYLSYSRGAPYLLIMGAAWAVCCWGYARFLLKPNARTSRLRPFGTMFVFAVLLAQVYGFVLAGS